MATYYKFLFGELAMYRGGGAVVELPSNFLRQDGDPVSYGAKLSETKAGRSKRRKNKRIKK